jgi:MFS family permease
MSLSAEAKHRLRVNTYVGGFFLNIAIAIASYGNSSFIEQFVGERSVGLIYIIISVASIIISFNTDALIKRLGNRTALLILTLINILALVGLMVYNHTVLTVIFFVIYAVLNFLISINLDLYLEDISDDRITGKIRGYFLTLANFAWLCSPFIAGILITPQGYTAMYALSAIAFIPLLYIVIVQLKNIPRARYEHRGIIPTLKKILAAGRGNNRDLRHILHLDFLLNFFYGTMTIYMPIYLHEHIGLPWDQIGIIFTIMLIPFVILDLILGTLADSWWGEKELLIGGLLVLAAATLLIPLLNSPSILLWGAILFLTRIGAATVEMMKESYLFKKIDGRDIDVVFISRNTAPLSYICAALLAIFWLSFFPFQYLFAVLGIIMLLGLPSAMMLKDTK